MNSIHSLSYGKQTNWISICYVLICMQKTAEPVSIMRSIKDRLKNCLKNDNSIAVHCFKYFNENVITSQFKLSIKPQIF